MNQLTVLNTRPREQAAELSRLLREAGFEAVEAPAIAIQPAWHPDELASVRDGLAVGMFSWVVLPSANAGRDLEIQLHQSQVVCGASTALALGLESATTLERFSATAALQVLRTRLKLNPGQRVLVPRAAEGRDELIDGLRALGADVCAPVAYRTVASGAAAERLRAGGIDVVALCSPSAVASVARALSPETIAVCLGRTTAQAAAACGVRVNGVAERTSMLALVDAVRAATGARA